VIKARKMKEPLSKMKKVTQDNAFQDEKCFSKAENTIKSVKLLKMKNYLQN
jgi:hypothetical protein